MGKSPLSRPNTVAMALLAAVAIPAVSASAQQTVTFVIDGPEGASTYTNTTSGITMTLSDPAEEDNVFAFGNDANDSYSGMGALNLSTAEDGYVTGFNVSFSADVQVIGYNVSEFDNYNDEETFSSHPLVAPTQLNSFSLTAGTASTTNNDLTAIGEHSINGTFFLPNGTAAAFATDIEENTYPTLYSITVEIPEPTTWTFLGLGGLCALLLRRWRRARVAS